MSFVEELKKKGRQMAEARPLLSTKDWIGVLVVIGGASAANMGAMHAISSNLNTQMVELDQRWQDRVHEMTVRLEEKIDNVESKIPPDWFRAMVDKNASDISEIRREFVRKTELDQVIRNGK